MKIKITGLRGVQFDDMRFTLCFRFMGFVFFVFLKHSEKEGSDQKMVLRIEGHMEPFSRCSAGEGVL